VDIRPQDLGEKWHALLVRRRIERARPRRRFADIGGDPSAAAPAARPLNPLERFWTRGAGLGPSETLRALAAMPGRFRRLPWAMATGALTMMGVGILGAGHAQTVAPLIGPLLASTAMLGLGVLGIPRTLFQRIHRPPLTPAEANELLPLAEDDLERDGEQGHTRRCDQDRHRRSTGQGPDHHELDQEAESNADDDSGQRGDEPAVAALEHCPGGEGGYGAELALGEVELAARLVDDHDAESHEAVAGAHDQPDNQ